MEGRGTERYENEADMIDEVFELLKAKRNDA
jgi:hypothetical protein